MIELRNIEKRYGDFVVFNNVNATINEGDVVAIIGPSGCGKSTLLNTINVLDRATDGQIIFDGVDLMDPSCDIKEYRKRIGMVFQSFNLFGHMTVLENAIIPQMDLLGRSRQEACDNAMEYLRLVGMADRAFHYPSELSGGQKQRAAIARTLSMDPEVLLLDEPTSALDPTMVGEVEYVLKKLASSGRTMVVVTHEMRLAKELSNRVFYLDEKGLYEEGSTTQIFEDPQKEKTKRFIKQLKCLDLVIDPECYDMAEIVAAIRNYGIRLSMNPRMIKRLQLLFEEFCIHGLIENGKISSEIDVTIEYNAKTNELVMNVSHAGDLGRNYLDEYSAMLVENIMEEIELKEHLV